MVEEHLVPSVVAVPEAGVAEDARLVLLAVAAYPNDVVAPKSVLAHLPRPAQAQLSNRPGAAFGRVLFGAEGIDADEARQELLDSRAHVSSSSLGSRCWSEFASAWLLQKSGCS